jgi:hypothetical protein
MMQKEMQQVYARGFAAGAQAASDLDNQAKRGNGKQPSGKAGELNAHHVDLSNHAVDSDAQLQIFWCDPRAFKETHMRDQLEAEMGTTIKCYRTAEMCMRLLRKKHLFQSKLVARLFLVSWSNAPALVSFLSEGHYLGARVIVLCDTCATKGCSRASEWALQYPAVTIAYTWLEALAALRQFTGECNHINT